MSKNSKYIIGFSVIAFSLILTSTTFAAFDLMKWQFVRGLNVPVQAGFVKVALPETVSSGGSNFSDIRIITEGDNVEVPYFITKNAVMRGGEMNKQILDQTVANGTTEFIIDTAEQGTIHTGFRIDSPLQNFRRQLSIYSSPTLLTMNSPLWRTVTNKGFIFKFTDPNTLFTSGKNTVNFPANTSRYLKVVIDAGPEGAVSVARATVYGETHIDVPVYDKVAPVTIFNNPNKKTTEVTVDLGEVGHITDSVTLTSYDKNFSRRVIVESNNNSGATSSWKYVAEGSISNISTSLFSGTSLKVSYLEQKTRYIRISIVNDDNRPLIIGSTVRVEGPVVSAIFETRANESYRLYYGNPKAVTPTYDISRISSYIETNKLPEATIGSEVTNPLYVAPALPVVPFTETNRTMLNIFLVIIVMIIGAGIGWYLYVYAKGNR